MGQAGVSEVEYHINDGVAVLTMSRWRANELSPSMRAALAEALDGYARNTYAIHTQTIRRKTRFSEADAALAAAFSDLLEG